MLEPECWINLLKSKCVSHENHVSHLYLYTHILIVSLHILIAAANSQIVI